MVRGVSASTARRHDIEMGLCPILNSTINYGGRGHESEIAIYSLFFWITSFHNWALDAFYGVHPIMDDGDADVVIVTIDGEEGENESIVMCQC